MANKTTGYLTTHILDTSKGCPASGVVFNLYFRKDVDSSEFSMINEGTTNADGRTDDPIIEKGDLKCGVYELRFYISDYFNSSTSSSPTFLEVVPVRFGIDDENSHYHIPLLVSPFGYSTYRGS